VGNHELPSAPFRAKIFSGILQIISPVGAQSNENDQLRSQLTIQPVAAPLAASRSKNRGSKTKNEA
jgi:hypothetical protein